MVLGLIAFVIGGTAALLFIASAPNLASGSLYKPLPSKQNDLYFFQKPVEENNGIETKEKKTRKKNVSESQVADIEDKSEL